MLNIIKQPYEDNLETPHNQILSGTKIHALPFVITMVNEEFLIIIECKQQLVLESSGSSATSKADMQTECTEVSM